MLIRVLLPSDLCKSVFSFDFYALTAHPDVDASTYFKAHFEDTLGKTFRPYDNQNIFSLALDKSFPQDNKNLLAALSENFYVVPVDLGEDPSSSLKIEREVKGSIDSPHGMGKFLFGVVTKYADAKEKKTTAEYDAFSEHCPTTFVMRNMPGGDITMVKFFFDH